MGSSFTTPRRRGEVRAPGTCLRPHVRGDVTTQTEVAVPRGPEARLSGGTHVGSRAGVTSRGHASRQSDVTARVTGDGLSHPRTVLPDSGSRARLRGQRGSPVRAPGSPHHVYGPPSPHPSSLASPPTTHRPRATQGRYLRLTIYIAKFD